MYKRKFQLRHVIKNFPELETETTPQEEHFGLPWCLVTERKNNFLSCFLHCNKEEDGENWWSVDVSVKMRIHSISGNDQPEFSSNGFFPNDEYPGCDKLADWDDVIDDLMVDNTVIIVCDVTIIDIAGIVMKRKLNFEKPKKNLTDVVLKVGEKKFHVSKMVLAVQSSYFEKLFFEDPETSNSSEIVLNVDDNAEICNFRTFLELIYGESNITEVDVESYLKLADQFDVNIVREKCEQYLLREGLICKRFKLRLADKHNLETLKMDCLDSVKTRNGLREILPNNVADLSHSTLAAFLQKNLSHSLTSSM